MGPERVRQSPGHAHFWRWKRDPTRTFAIRSVPHPAVETRHNPIALSDITKADVLYHIKLFSAVDQILRKYYLFLFYFYLCGCAVLFCVLMTL